MEDYQGKSLQIRTKPQMTFCLSGREAERNATQHVIELGPAIALVSLGPRSRHHRHARLRLVDEPLSGPAGPVLLPLDPRRHRLSRVAVDGIAADLARHQ